MRKIKYCVEASCFDCLCPFTFNQSTSDGYPTIRGMNCIPNCAWFSQDANSFARCGDKMIGQITNPKETK
jgi:hypothetical protein